MIVSRLILIITYIVSFFLYTIILWKISKKQKFKKHNLKTAISIIGITFVVILIILLISRLIIFPLPIKIFIGMFTFILTPFLIKKFYRVGWWKAIKVYLLMILITCLIIFVTFFIITFLMVIITPLLK